jgi:hypothetical protein
MDRNGSGSGGGGGSRSQPTINPIGMGGPGGFGLGAIAMTGVMGAGIGDCETYIHYALNPLLKIMNSKP